MYTSIDVQTAILSLLKGSDLERNISGQILRAGLRPRDSQEEDLTVAVTALSAEQRQSGVVRLTIFVPDFAEGSASVRRTDLKRCAELERMLTDWALSLTTDKTGDLIIRLAEAAKTVPSPEAPQSLVALRLSIRIAS